VIERKIGRSLGCSGEIIFMLLLMLLKQLNVSSMFSFALFYFTCNSRLRRNYAFKVYAVGVAVKLSRMWSFVNFRLDLITLLKWNVTWSRFVCFAVKLHCTFSTVCLNFY
jgi:hypothetical protein